MTFTEFKDIILIGLSILNLGIVPIAIYVVRIEKRSTLIDADIGRIRDACPIFNLGVCPARSAPIQPLKGGTNATA